LFVDAGFKANDQRYDPMPFKNPDVRRRYERERLRKLRAEARRERAAEAAELRARGIARHGTELRWLLAGLRAEPWDVVMAQLRERAE
jgi:hypothetical protein